MYDQANTNTQPNTQTQGQTKYYIDQNVLGFLYGLSNEDDLNEVYVNYLAGLQDIIAGGINAYTKEINMPESEAAEFIKLFKEQTATDEETTDQTKENKLRELMSVPALQLRLEMLINEFNKIIYNRQVPTLTKEAKDTLNLYIEQMEKVNQANTGVILTMNKFVDTLKKQEEEFNRQKTTAPEFPIEKQEQPIAIQDESVAPATTQTESTAAAVPVSEPATITSVPSKQPTNTVASVQQQLGELANQVKTSPYPQLNLSQTGVVNQNSPQVTPSV
jgi:hypothetical protein